MGGELKEKKGSKYWLEVGIYLPILIFMLPLIVFSKVPFVQGLALEIVIFCSFLVFHFSWDPVPTKVTVIGPSRSGKTSMLATIWYLLRRLGKVEASPYVNNYFNELLGNARSSGSSFHIRNRTKQVTPVRFMIEGSDLEFSDGILFSTSDIPGVLYERFANDYSSFLDQLNESEREVVIDYNTRDLLREFLDSRDDEKVKKRYERLFDNLSSSDVLTLIIDPTGGGNDDLDERSLSDEANRQLHILSGLVKIAIESSKNTFGELRTKGILVVFNKKDIHGMSVEDAKKLTFKGYLPPILDPEEDIPVVPLSSQFAGWEMNESPRVLMKKTNAGHLLDAISGCLDSGKRKRLLRHMKNERVLHG